MCYGIYDGHGGKGAADCLQECLHEKILEQAKQHASKRESKDEDYVIPDHCIVNAYHAMDQMCHEKVKTSGSCALDVFITLRKDGSRHVKCAWVGDCRAAIFQGKRYKAFRDISADHNLKREDEKDRILIYGKTHGGAFVERRRNKNGDPVGPWAVFARPPEKNDFSLNVTRSIGDTFHSKAIIATPEIKSFVVSEDEHLRVVLASDGLWRVFDKQRVRRYLKHLTTPGLSANQLAASSVFRTQKHTMYALDDVTVTVIDIFPSVSEVDTDM